jgi:hypothetical protein
MKPKTAFLLTGCVFLCVSLVAQDSVPPYSGTWQLDLKRSRIEINDPPVASTTTIRYDGRVWNFSRTHLYAHEPPNTRSFSFTVNSPDPQVTHQPSMTIHTRVTRERGEIILHQDYAAATGERATNTVHYRLQDAGNTLIEDEREVTPDGNHHNVWVLTRTGK